MSEFFKLVYELMATIFNAIYSSIRDIFSALFYLLIGAWKQYLKVFGDYTEGFNAIQWIGAIILGLIIIAVPVCILIFIIMRIRTSRQMRKNKIDSKDMMREINLLNQQVDDLIREKNQIMAMKVSQLGLRPGEDNEASYAVASDVSAEPVSVEIPQLNEDGSVVKVSVVENEENSATQKAIRFPKLALVDEKYREQPPIVYDDTITLEQFVSGFRNYAASRLKLYYDSETIRLFVAGMASTKIIILEGMSGTGKTSLPYAFSHYLQNACTMVSVQPSYRDRTELLGYFNEFSKKFNETEFLRAVYEAGANDKPSIIVLDEMNLARIEYYFAEILSVLEMPTPSEWTVDLVPTAWNNDPERIIDGKLLVSTGLWFVGTANNDDSTFTITDKVYDRAMAIELNKRADRFEAEDTPDVCITYMHLQEMFAKAIAENQITETAQAKLDKLDTYLQTRFKLAFGNRIQKQLHCFVPVYVACGGSEMIALDFFIARKILKKFESMNVTYVRDEIKELIVFIEKTFGKTNLMECKKYLQRIQNLF